MSDVELKVGCFEAERGLTIDGPCWTVTRRDRSGMDSELTFVSYDDLWDLEKLARELRTLENKRSAAVSRKRDADAHRAKRGTRE